MAFMCDPEIYKCIYSKSPKVPENAEPETSLAMKKNAR